jgi:hypothetical protein
LVLGEVLGIGEALTALLPRSRLMATAPRDWVNMMDDGVEGVKRWDYSVKNVKNETEEWRGVE